MAPEVAGRPIRPLTADEAMRMVEVGILDEHERVELLDGVLEQLSPKSAEHQELIVRLVQWLAPPRPAGYRVRTEAPVLVPDRFSLPEPDIVVFSSDVSLREHPTTALLVIEVAVSSQRRDLERKPRYYSSAGVTEYWVIDVPSRRLVRFAEPSADGYVQRDVVAGADAKLTPVAVPVSPLALAELFEGL